MKSDSPKSETTGFETNLSCTSVSHWSMFISLILLSTPYSVWNHLWKPLENTFQSFFSCRRLLIVRIRQKSESSDKTRSSFKVCFFHKWPLETFNQGLNQSFFSKLFVGKDVLILSFPWNLFCSKKAKTALNVRKFWHWNKRPSIIISLASPFGCQWAKASHVKNSYKQK